MCDEVSIERQAFGGSQVSSSQTIVQPGAAEVVHWLVAGVFFFVVVVVVDVVNVAVVVNNIGNWDCCSVCL